MTAMTDVKGGAEIELGDEGVGPAQRAKLRV